MNYDPEQVDPSDVALNALLAEARWPEPSANSTHRLAAFYRAQPRGARDLRWLVAASVLLACGIGLVATRLPRAIPKSPDRVALLPAPATPVPPASVEAPRIAPLASRAPTSLELARLAVAERGAHLAKPVGPSPGAVDRAVSLVSKGPSPRSLKEALELLGREERRQTLRELWTVVLSPHPVRSRAASELISAGATAESVPLLLQMDRIPAARDAAVDALARVAWPGLLANLVRSHPDFTHRRVLVAAMLRTSQGASAYLDLVADPSSSRDMLAVLDGIASPPTEPFFAALRDPHVSVRLAAAKVLGRIDGPATTARLVALTQRNDCRREALIALADSRGPEARQFLQEAKRSGPLAGAVRSILIDPSLNE